MKRSCIYCDSSDRLLKDHFIPKSVTRQDIYLVNCCHRCNLSKRNQHPKIWYFRHFGDREKWEHILEAVCLSDGQIDAYMRPQPHPVSMQYKLLDLMRLKGIDQKTLAAETKISPTTIGKLCRNHSDRIDVSTVETLCKYFKLQSISELIEVVWE